MKSLNGVLLLNKPQGLSAHSALQRAKRLYAALKAGHTGSLDPLATGMLPLCFGEATKVCQFLLDADKAYEATGFLGVTTDTLDATGTVLSQSHDFEVTAQQLQQVLDRFRGPIKQVPPMYSALKHQGKALYRYARAGVDLHRDPREVTINHLELSAFDGREFSLLVHCSKGTYIRSLLADIGEALGVGAHLTALHRQFCGQFRKYPMYTLEQLNAMSLEEREVLLLSMDKVVDYLPLLILDGAEILQLRQGKRVHRIAPFGLYRAYDQQEHFIGLIEAEADELKVKRLLSF